MEKFFVKLFESFGAENSLRHFSLESYGSMVLFEKGDGLRNLRFVGMDVRTDGLFDIYPEYVELECLQDGTDEVIRVYKMGYMQDNEHMLFLFLISGQWDVKTEIWLKNQVLN